MPSVGAEVVEDRGSWCWDLKLASTRLSCHPSPTPIATWLLLACGAGLLQLPLIEKHQTKGEEELGQ
jgi:hypothetical protein